MIGNAIFYLGIAGSNYTYDSVYFSHGRSFSEWMSDNSVYYDSSRPLRPIVTLKSSAQLTLETEGTDGNIFNITKY